MATTQELIDYYAGLLIIQYLGKPRAYATIQMLAKPIIMDQLPLLVQAAYSIDTAVGAQLDKIGKYVGVSRSALTFAGPVILDDTDYRILIKMKIVQNNSGSSLAEIQSLLFTFFPGSVHVYDYQNMRMSYIFASTFGSMDLAEAFVREGLLPKPMAVQLASLIYIPDIDNIFGFRTYANPAITVKGFNTYGDYQTDWPWLSYANAITP